VLINYQTYNQTYNQSKQYRVTRDLARTVILVFRNYCKA